MLWLVVVATSFALAGCPLCPDDGSDHYVSSTITAPTADQLELLDRCTEADDCDAICTEALKTAEGYDETFEIYACDVTRSATARIHVRYTIGPPPAC